MAAVAAGVATFWPATTAARPKANSLMAATAASAGSVRTDGTGSLASQIQAARGELALRQQESAVLIARQAAARQAAARKQAAASAAGKAAAAGDAAATAQRPAQKQQPAAQQQGQTRQSQAAPAPAPPSGSPQQIAMGMLGSYGWSSSQFSCLDSLWNQESGWDVTSSNPSSGAYGIPQALPGSKMASAGADWQTDAATQIRWGLSYIQSTYGSPCGGWAHEEADGWY